MKKITKGELERTLDTLTVNAVLMPIEETEYTVGYLDGYFNAILLIQTAFGLEQSAIITMSSEDSDEYEENYKKELANLIKSNSKLRCRDNCNC